MPAGKTVTDTTAYPAFATKAAFMTAFKEEVEVGNCNRDHLMDLLYRLSNTDTDNWTAGSTARHDA